MDIVVRGRIPYTEKQTLNVHIIRDPKEKTQEIVISSSEIPIGLISSIMDSVDVWLNHREDD